MRLHLSAIALTITLLEPYRVSPLGKRERAWFYWEMSWKHGYVRHV